MSAVDTLPVRRSGKIARFDPILSSLVLLTWVSIVPRLVPDRSLDRGIFVSVAERLIAGDALYTGVWDNKDPLFYYFVAGQLALGPWAEVAAEALSIAIAVAAVYAMVARLASRWTALAISFIAAPITLTGEVYIPGYTELPGVALALAAIGAAACARPRLSGFCIGLLIFTKLIFTPVALVGAGCFLMDRLIFRCDGLGSYGLRAALLGLCLAVVPISLVLIERGEFWPFIDCFRLNVDYSQGSLIGGNKGFAALLEHLRLAGGPHFSMLMMQLMLINILGLIALSTRREPHPGQLTTIRVSLLTLFASLAVLSLTGLWRHHAEILNIPSLIGIVGLAPLFDVAAASVPSATALVVTLASVLMAGNPAMAAYVMSARNFRTSYARLDDLSPEAQRILAVSDSGAYARIGGNDDLGHSVGLRSWKLVCPRFHQYRFLSAAVLDDVFKCAAKAPTLIISADFAPANGFPDWNNFVDRVERLAVSYSCDAASGLRVCTRGTGKLD
jgi:hypothetical protein